MIALYLRSSSLSDYDLCEHKYFIGYTLGFKFEVGKPAQKGSCVHKCCELLGLKKLAIQNGQSLVDDPEIEKRFNVNELTPEIALINAYAYYSKISTFEWVNKDYEDCKKWLQEILTYRAGMFSPVKRHIVDVEKHFELPIEKDWAKYNYEIQGQKLSGQLEIKGTVDLVTRINNETLEAVDWKTGSTRKCWVKNIEKNYKEFRNDIQTRLYHYSLCRIYPEVKHFILTFFYTQAGGAFSVDFNKDDAAETEDRLFKYYDRISKNKKPRLIAPSFKCKFCAYSKEKFENSGKTYCDFFKEKIIQLGIDKVQEKWLNVKELSNYSGGGKTLIKEE